jgi:hypothetical protein
VYLRVIIISVIVFESGPAVMPAEPQETKDGLSRGGAAARDAMTVNRNIPLANISMPSKIDSRDTVLNAKIALGRSSDRSHVIEGRCSTSHDN